MKIALVSPSEKRESLGSNEVSESECLFFCLLVAISEGAGICGRSSGRSGSSVGKRRLSTFFLKGDLPDFSWGFFFWQGLTGEKVGHFFKILVFFPFYIYTFYQKADRWGRLVGGKFPMPVCHYNTLFDTSRSPPFFFTHIINYIIHICCICTLLQKWWNCWAAIPLFLEQKVHDVC